MKRLQHIALAALLTSTAAAQKTEDAPSQKAVRPDAVDLQVIKLDLNNPKSPPEVTKVKSPIVYLGISPAATSEAIASQLDITAGFGLSVLNKVDADSPAGKAGIQKHDVLYKIDGQLLVNTDQFMSLLATFKVGDQIDLSYFRKGKLAVSKVTLEKRKTLPVSQNGLDQMNFTISTHILPESGITANLIPADGLKIKDGEFQLDLTLLDGVQSKVLTQHILKKMILLNDENGTCTLKHTKEGLHLKAQDKQGNEIFNGVIEPETEWAKIPDNLLPSVSKMKKLLIRADNKKSN